MAIEINKVGKDKINPPAIVLTGDRIDSSNGQPLGQSSITITDQDVDKNGLTIRHSGELIFREQITVDLLPDNGFLQSDYSYKNASHQQDFRDYSEVAVSTNNVIGQNTEGLVKNVRSETYYSLNGKSPKRTKDNLYTGSFKIRRNTSGTDNIVLKSRTYAKGYASEVRTTKLRIVKDNNKIL